MGGKAQRRKGNHAKNKEHGKSCKQKRYTRDIDQIVFTDMLPEETKKLLDQKCDEDKPGLGQFYCVTCARYFISSTAQSQHLKTKEHKKRFKQCTTVEPYTIEESLRAAGMHVPAK